jgi:Zn-dependent protease with chaperone function
MDFFSAQEAAKRKTAVLITYFILAVLFIIGGIYVALLFAWISYDGTVKGLWHPDLLLCTALGVLLVVLTGIVTKSLALSKGGEAVAILLGGVPINPNSDDPDERKLLNVVEEMAIASGLPVPRVFLLPEENGINAFAAGIKTSDAAVAVTAGCLRRLNRDELQGVIGHEFSHILNGDMRVNVRLMGIIFGIFMIASIGRGILRGGSRTRVSSRGKKGGGAWPILVVALIILAIGYIGVFFGRLIQAAVSRQRELLADASAVQFTRNPPGLAGALKKISNHTEGSRLVNPHAEEASHFFFSAFRKSLFSRWLSTHPPLEDRIQRLEPSFKKLTRRDRSEIRAGKFGTHRVQLSPAGFAATVGSPQPQQLAYAEKLIMDLPPLVKEANHESFGAQALVCCLLLSKEGGVRKPQLDWLQAHADASVLREVSRIMPLIDRIGRGHRLPLAEMAMPALKTLSPPQYQAFRRIVQSLVAADKKVSLFEYALHRMLVRHLDGFFSKRKGEYGTYHTVHSVEKEVFLLLSTLAWTGNQDREAAQAAFTQGLAILEVEGEPPVIEKEECTFQALDGGLEKLGRAAPALKKKLLMSCVACVSHDEWISVEEFELLRAVADSMDLPVPPLFPGKLIPS